MEAATRVLLLIFLVPIPLVRMRLLPFEGLKCYGQFGSSPSPSMGTLVVVARCPILEAISGEHYI
ncbi:uncharacterized protein BDW43DRAFT_262178 [Aspergillus alliaceus]|uniref:uncharacterized protein n=1 Tax=Petromyces alliaceus TaxID=209559 RepID=UPI0012A55001|nr:uncharacterized protein BDW43DRAFT_262178 [Aspergillus alliaceus]KAB8238609.1 hypothetical protein BDW43DRAFT_262178 [Aspergillus alliaceus]